MTRKTRLTRLLAAALAALSCTFVNAAIVDAGAVTTVTVETPLYDTRTGTAGGCGSAGCVGALTRDGDLATPDSRWSCKPALGPSGSTCSITYGLADMVSIRGLNIAMYKGDERTRTMDVYVDGDFATSWTSSGTTTDFETVDLSADAQTVEIHGVLDDSEWLSIMEVEILVDDGADYEVVEAGTLGTVTTAAVWYDPRLSDANGCDPAGCTADLTRDGDLTDTSRWSCAPNLGGTCTISYDLGAARDISEVRLAMFKGDERTRSMGIYVDGVIVTTWTSSGTTTGFETVNMGVLGQTIELRGILADSEWISIIETEIMVLDGTVLPTPAPQSTPTPSSTTPPVAAPTGTLQPVGPIPLASGGSSSYSDFERYSVKDGDLSTSWTCTGGPRREDLEIIYYDCTLGLSMVYYRHIKQVKIALADGDERQVDMRISGVSNSEAAEEFVTSSGTTTGFEVYDFDYFTRYIQISGVFATEGQSISISEVEIVEELRPDEVSVARFNDPFDSDEILGKDSTVDGFRWFTDSDEALGEYLSFFFSSFATVTAMELQFPVGDTYLFDLWISYTPDDGDEPFAILTGLESANVEGWQRFDLGLDTDHIADWVLLVMRGTGSGAPGFYMSNARFIGSAVPNPTDTFYVGSTYIDGWTTTKYPDFVAEGSGDQKAIMGAICAVKKASFDGVDCVGEDATATGTVYLPMGSWFVNGNIFMKSGVFLDGRYSIDDSPHTTDINLEAGAAGNTDIGPIIVMDGISNAKIDDLWIFGQYDPDTGSSIPAVDGLGSTCISITSSENITCVDTWVEFCDGDGWVVQDSSAVAIDAGDYDEEYHPWRIASHRGTGLVVGTSDDVWVRRYAVYDNGVAGIHITDSKNFIFEATIGDGHTEGEGRVGSIDGQQPIEIIVESSTLVTFQDMKVLSTNDPVMTISGDSSDVFCNNCGFSNVETGTCVIQTEDPATIIADDDELVLVDTCYVKV